MFSLQQLSGSIFRLVIHGRVIQQWKNWLQLLHFWTEPIITTHDNSNEGRRSGSNDSVRTDHQQQAGRHVSRTDTWYPSCMTSATSTWYLHVFIVCSIFRKRNCILARQVDMDGTLQLTTAPKHTSRSSIFRFLSSTSNYSFFKPFTYRSIYSVKGECGGNSAQLYIQRPKLTCTCLHASS